MKVILYTKLPDASGACPHCERAKTWLKDHSIPYEEEVLDRPARLDLYDTWGLVGEHRTVPQVVLRDRQEDRLIGGFDKLKSSKLETLFLTESPHPPVELGEPQIEVVTPNVIRWNKTDLGG